MFLLWARIYSNICSNSGPKYIWILVSADFNLLNIFTYLFDDVLVFWIYLNICLDSFYAHSIIPDTLTIPLQPTEYWNMTCFDDSGVWPVQEGLSCFVIFLPPSHIHISHCLLCLVKLSTEFCMQIPCFHRIQIFHKKVFTKNYVFSRINVAPNTIYWPNIIYSPKTIFSLWLCFHQKTLFSPKTPFSPKQCFHKKPCMKKIIDSTGWPHTRSNLVFVLFRFKKANAGQN